MSFTYVDWGGNVEKFQFACLMRRTGYVSSYQRYCRCLEMKLLLTFSSFSAMEISQDKKANQDTKGFVTFYFP